MRTARLKTSWRGRLKASGNWVSSSGTVIVQLPYRKALVNVWPSAMGR